MDTRISIGERLAQIRGGANRAEWGLRYGVHRNTLGGYERGERATDADYLGALAADGWSAQWILTGQGAPRVAAAAEDPAPYHAGRRYDAELLGDVVVVLEEWLAARGVALAPERKARAVRLLYEIAQDELVATDGGRPERARILRLVQLVA